MKRPRYFINSLEKGLNILKKFSVDKPELTLSELAKENDMTLGTAHRYLLTLKELGYLAHDSESKKYILTAKVLSLGFSFLNSLELRKLVFPYMIQIAKEFNLGSRCSVLEGTEIVFIEHLRSKEIVNLEFAIGSRLPAHCTAAGKVMLAFLDEKRSRELINEMKLVPLTPYTITKKRVLMKELQVIRERGYATSNQELALGFRGLAVPIFRNSKVEAALGLLIPCQRAEFNGLDTVYIKKLLEISEKVSTGHK